ncbi:hypothetical protein ACFO0N_06735 [Halobium salinum]|uniref:VanZ like family protein n=2 Tax=Halobium salinum TaxID=1364940 RepID=A0ABD5PA82_9EURY
MGWPWRTLARFFGQLRADLGRRRTALAWAVIIGWGLLVCVFHFGGLAYGVYVAVPWWDLLTHSMGGAGVAAILYAGFCRPVRSVRAPLWLVPALFAIGAGFEVYEYLFKDFWWHWSVEFYVEDTVVDLVLDTAGAAVVLLGHVVLRRFVGGTADDAVDAGPATESTPSPAPEPASDGGVSRSSRER